MTKDSLESPTMKNNMRNKGDIKGLEIVVIAESNDPDADVALMFDGILQNDLEEFFFGANVKIIDNQTNDLERKKERLPKVC